MNRIAQFRPLAKCQRRALACTVQAQPLVPLQPVQAIKPFKPFKPSSHQAMYRTNTVTTNRSEVACGSPVPLGLLEGLCHRWHRPAPLVASSLSATRWLARAHYLFCCGPLSISNLYAVETTAHCELVADATRLFFDDDWQCARRVFTSFVVAA